jgi:zona occludens toxin (predicted ATPase)
MSTGFRTVFDGRNLQRALTIVTGPVLDNAKIGTSDTTLPHVLGRVPNGYIMYRSSSGGQVYDASTGESLWSRSSIVLRATVAGTFSVLIF